MKSWADHCSSDEESIDRYDNNGTSGHSSLFNGDDDLSDSKSNPEEMDGPPSPPPLLLRDQYPEDFPSTPPFTAHVGNLSYHIKDPKQLTIEVERLVEFRYKGSQKVNITDTRIGVDRETGKMKGFGYIEFETAEQLMVLLNLNDDYSIIGGRNIRIDIAQSTRKDRRQPQSNMRSSDHNGMDSMPGRQFRGGRYTNKPTNNPGHNINDTERNTDGGGRKVRPSLKLAPRSLAAAGDKMKNQHGNIFGGAKPRDETVLRESECKKDSPEEKTMNQKKNGDSSNTAVNDSGIDSQTKGNIVNNKDSQRPGRRRVDRRANPDGKGQKLNDSAKNPNKQTNNSRNNRASNVKRNGNKSTIAKDRNQKTMPLPIPTLPVRPKEKKDPSVMKNSFAALGFSDSE